MRKTSGTGSRAELIFGTSGATGGFVKLFANCVIVSRDNVIYGILEDTNENPY